MQYESNLSTNCSNTDLVALVISFFSVNILTSKKGRKENFRNISSKKKRRRERPEYKHIEEQEKG